LLGQVSQAELVLSNVDTFRAPAMLGAIAELVAFDIAFRRGHAGPAAAAIDRARQLAHRARIPALSVEIERASELLHAPAARLIEGGEARLVPLERVESVLASSRLLIDARRRTASLEQERVTLARRPVLFALLRALAEAWPNELSREALTWAGFGVRRVNPSLRARLRVELGRLRKEMRALAHVQATPQGFVLAPIRALSIAVLAPTIEGVDAALLGLIADGAAWSTSGLALSLGSSPRTVQRALATLEAAGHARSFGRGRARRWIAPPASGFTTAMLLSQRGAIG
jgi:hypothetical protein